MRTRTAKKMVLSKPSWGGPSALAFDDQVPVRPNSVPILSRESSDSRSPVFTTGPIITQDALSLRTPALEYIKENRDKFLKKLCSLIRIPSVGPWTTHQAELNRAAEVVADDLRDCGLNNVQFLQVANAPPYVYGEWMECGPMALTVLLYAHYDVQAPGDSTKWDSPAFEPEVREGAGGKRLFGRGACDDKSGIVIHTAVIESLLQSLGRLPVNVKVLIEGEEELGSPHIADCFEQHNALLKSDVALLLSTGNFDTGIPSLTYSTRGIVSFTIETRVVDEAIHSGNAGPIVDPIIALSHIIASFHKPDGTVAIKGFYDNCRRITVAEREKVKSLNYTEEKMRNELGLLPSAKIIGEREYLPLERIWLRPALSVIGFDACPIALSANRILPTARAKVSCRTVAHQSSAAILRAVEDHCERIKPFGCEIKIVANEITDPWICEPSGAMFAACEKGLSLGYGAPTVLLGCGGSLPFITQVAASLPDSGIALGIGLGDPAGNSHAENESISLNDVEKAMLSMIHILFQLSTLKQVML